MEKFYGKVLWKSFIFKLTFVFFVFSGCQKETFQEVLPTKNPLPVDDYYDQKVAQLADSGFKSFSDISFTQLLKTELMKIADGDYDVILKKFVYKLAKIQTNPISALLEVDNLKNNGGNQLSELLKKYPNLQISMPVNAEKWDGKSKVHVAWLPSDCNEGITKEIPAIDPNGEKVMLDAEKIPDFPVIVVCLNERSDENGNILFAYNNEKPEDGFDPSLRLKMTGNEGFSAFTATSATASIAIMLTWNFIYPTEYASFDHYFAVYRDDLTGGGYKLIAEVSPYNNWYNDAAVLSGRTYSYYVADMVDFRQTGIRSQYIRAYTSQTASATTATAQNFTSNFTVENVAPTVMELKWTINNFASRNNIKIERLSQRYPTPIIKANLAITNTYYLDYITDPNSIGDKFRYLLKVENTNTGENQSYFNEAYYSNRPNGQYLYFKGIHFTDMNAVNKYKPWYEGKMEIKIKIIWCLYNGEPQALREDLFENLTRQSHTNFNVELFRWDKNSNGTILTISATEIDAGGSGNKEIIVGSEIKVTSLPGIESKLSYTKKSTIGSDTNDNYMGTGYLYFWDNATNKDVQLNSDVKLSYSTP